MDGTKLGSNTKLMPSRLERNEREREREIKRKKREKDNNVLFLNINSDLLKETQMPHITLILEKPLTNTGN